MSVLDLADTPAVVLRREDVRVDTFRATGPGGQHRNKTDSGVRLTHLPTGLVVTATEDRSQHTNRDVAWRRLRDQLGHAQQAVLHDGTNAARRADLAAGRAFTWTAWRDEVRAPDGRSARMASALRGNLRALLT